jgi:hypothetical protein
MDDTKDTDFFNKAVAEVVEDLRHHLAIMGWKPCLSEHGKVGDSEFQAAANSADMLGRSIVVIRCFINQVFSPKPGRWDKSLNYKLMVVRISSICLDDFDPENGGYLQLPQFELEGKTHQLVPHVDLFDQGSLDKWQLIAFERTNGKLPDIIHMCGRASAPATSQIYSNISTPHNTTVGALSCLNI